MKNKNNFHLLTAFIALLLTQPLPAQGWLELPATDKGQKGCIISTQYMRRDGKVIRSHTYKYDPSLRISLWVAYPLNAGLIGEGSRGEGWHPYDNIDRRLQSVLYKGFKYGSGFDRGHQIPSADRLENRSNDATFTFVNAVPQDHSFNEGPWADLERLVRTWAKRSDTLYVVTGCIPGRNSIKDNDGNPVNIPAAFWKAVLRKNTDKKGNTHWTSCAVCMPHTTVRPDGLNWPERMDFLSGFKCSVKELEAMTGEDLFTNFEKQYGKKNSDEIETSGYTDPWWFK